MPAAHSWNKFHCRCVQRSKQCSQLSQPIESPSIPQDHLRRRVHRPAAAPITRGAAARIGQMIASVVGSSHRHSGPRAVAEFPWPCQYPVVAVCDVDTTRREHHQKLADDFYKPRGPRTTRVAPPTRNSPNCWREDIDAVVIACPITGTPTSRSRAAKPGQGRLFARSRSP